MSIALKWYVCSWINSSGHWYHVWQSILRTFALMFLALHGSIYLWQGLNINLVGRIWDQPTERLLVNGSLYSLLLDMESLVQMAIQKILDNWEQIPDKLLLYDYVLHHQVVDTLDLLTPPVLYLIQKLWWWYPSAYLLFIGNLSRVRSTGYSCRSNKIGITWSSCSDINSLAVMAFYLQWYV